MAAKITMMAVTTRSSISVKNNSFFLFHKNLLRHIDSAEVKVQKKGCGKAREIQ